MMPCPCSPLNRTSSLTLRQVDHQRIDAGTACNRAAGPDQADEIISLAAVESVIAAPACQTVVSRPAVDEVIAAASFDLIGAG